MQLPVGDHLLQVVGQQLAPNVQPTDSAAYPLALDERSTVGEAKARINNQAAPLFGQIFPVLKRALNQNCSKEGFESKLLMKSL